MKTQDVEKLAKELIKQHLGSSWRFRFDRSTGYFGRCYGSHKLITISKPLSEINDEDQVRDTILHEIAHGLAGCENGHNHIWKERCKQIGARPERCYPRTVTRPEPRYLLICNNCGRIRAAYKKRVCSCGKCSNGVYNPNYKMDCIPFKDCPSKYRTLYYLSR